MPAPIRDIMRAAYGDAIAEVFLISAIIGLVALVAILFIKERPLRRTVDIKPTTASPVEPGIVGGAGPATTGALPVADRRRSRGRRAARCGHRRAAQKITTAERLASGGTTRAGRLCVRA